MSARADTAARDLLARLIDETELESASIEEVRGDLALFDIDSARAIRFSRKLAENSASPAGALLAKTLAAEAADNEISAIERTDLESVRAELSAASPDSAARSEELVQQSSARHPRPRSRQWWYGAGGAAGALAASLLIFVAMNSREPLRLPLPSESSQDVAMRAPDASLAPGALAVPPPEPPASPTAAASASELQQRTDSTVIASGGSSKSANDAASQLRGESEAAPSDVGLVEVGTPEGKSQSESRTRELAQLTTESIDLRSIGDLTVAAALILQPELAPEPMRQADLGQGDLAAQLPSAARSVARSHAVALLTLTRANGATADYVLLRLPAFAYDETGAAAEESVQPRAELPEPLPAAPTLRQLLGDAAGEFRVLELVPDIGQ
jgi:hypothetical protein